MEEEQKGVVAETPAVEASQEAVQETTEDSQQSQVEVAEDTEIQTAPPVGDEQVVLEALDESGVPYKNRYMEAQRKLDKTQKQQEEILSKLDTIQTGEKKPEYTIDDLETFALNTENESYRLWAHKKIRELGNQETAKIVSSELDKRDQVRVVEQTKQGALNDVMQRYPDAFLRDNAGKTTGWNSQSPITQRISEYMQDPELKNNPRGLLVAAALAYSDVSTGTGMKAKQQNQKLKDEVKTLQRKTLVDGGGNDSVVPKSTRQVAIEKSKSGKPVDAVDAMKELWKATGRLQE